MRVKPFASPSHPQPHNANPESSWRRIANVSFSSAARWTFKLLRAPGQPDCKWSTIVPGADIGPRYVCFEG